MINDLKNKLIIVLLIIIFLGAFFGGLWVGHKTRPPSQVLVDTVYVYDTVVYTIPIEVPYYIVKTDTIIFKDTIEIPADVDTALILKNYYAEHYYNRTWEDSLIRIDQIDMVTENRIYAQKLDYKFLKPQTTIINNSYTNYYRYLSTGAFLALSGTEYIFGPKILYIDKSVSTGLEIGLNEKFVGISIGKTFKIGK